MEEKRFGESGEAREDLPTRKWLRLAWVPNHSWIAVAEAAAMTTPTAKTGAMSGESSARRAMKGAKTMATPPITASIFARTTPRAETGGAATRSGAS
jgi:hypothetical protein